MPSDKIVELRPGQTAKATAKHVDIKLLLEMFNRLPPAEQQKLFEMIELLQDFKADVAD